MKEAFSLLACPLVTMWAWVCPVKVEAASHYVSSGAVQESVASAATPCTDQAQTPLPLSVAKQRVKLRGETEK